MKRLFYLLICALPLLTVTSCDDDNDMPDVDFIIDIADAVYKDGNIYVVAGETLDITSIQVVNKEQGRNALISYADYYWDYLRIAQSIVPPFGAEIYINPETPTGKHLLEIYAPVYAEDKTPAYAVLNYPVIVVADAADLPADGAVSFTDAPAIKETDPSK